MRAGRFAEADIANLVEEIEAFRRSEAAALESAYRLICLHQLKRLLQPERVASRGGTNTITRERLHAARVLRDDSSLEPRQAELAGAYADARKEAAGETRQELRTIPDATPFTLGQVVDEEFWAGPLPP